MKRAEIIRNGIVTNMAELPEKELTEWLASHKAMGTFGREEQFKMEPKVIKEEVLDESGEVISPAEYEMESVLVKEAELDENGAEVAPAEYEERVKLYKVVTAPAEYSVVITDIAAEIDAAKAQEDKMLKGKMAREICQNVLDLIAGYNLDRELTMEQITEMQNTFASSESALRSGRPSLAKQAISAIAVDGVLVTQEMKDACLSLLANY